MQGLRDENHTLATARSVLQFQVNELTLQLSSALSDRDFIEEKLAASRLELQTLESTMNARENELLNELTDAAGSLQAKAAADLEIKSLKEEAVILTEAAETSKALKESAELRISTLKTDIATLKGQIQKSNEAQDAKQMERSIQTRNKRVIPENESDEESDRAIPSTPQQRNKQRRRGSPAQLIGQTKSGVLPDHFKAVKPRTPRAPSAQPCWRFEGDWRIGRRVVRVYQSGVGVTGTVVRWLAADGDDIALWGVLDDDGFIDEYGLWCEADGEFEDLDEKEVSLPVV